MNTLEESRGLVVVDADDYGIPDELISSLVALSLPFINKKHLTYPHFVRPKPFGLYTKIGENIASLLGLKAEFDDGYLLEYYKG